MHCRQARPGAGASRGLGRAIATALAAEGAEVVLAARNREIDAANAKRQGTDVATIVAQSRATIPLGRYGKPAEFASAAAFPASAPAAHVRLPT